MSDTNQANEVYAGSADVNGAESAHQENGTYNAGSKHFAEVDRLTAAIESNRRDFDSWNALLTAVEKESDNERFSALCESFLAEFPLCYGFWKKYADTKFKQSEDESGIDAAIQVYERGIQAVPYSVDLWTSYCSFLIQRKDDPTLVRQTFERAVATVGADWMSHPLWDKYVEYENSKEAFTHMSAIYARIIQTPLQMLENYWERHFVDVKAYFDVIRADEIEALKQQLTSESKSEITEMEYKQAFLKEHETRFLATMEKANKRRVFETPIKRYFFHNRPLDETQLSAWRSFVEYAAKEESYDDAKVIFERCLVACCNYAEFWIRYSNLAEDHNDQDLALHILSRGATIYNKIRPEIHLELADVYETRGSYPEAETVYENLLSLIAPGHIESAVRAAAYYRRRSNPAKAIEILKTAHTAADQKFKTYLSLQLAHATAASGHVDEGRSVLEAIVESAGDSKAFWNAFINFESNYGGESAISRISSLIERAASDASKLGHQEKVELLIHQVDYLVEKQADIASIRKARQQLRHAQRLRAQESRKRSADDSGNAQKYARTGVLATPSAGVVAAASTASAAATGSQAAAAAAWAGYGYPQGYAAGYGYNYNYGATPATGVTPAASGAAPIAAAYAYPGAYNYAGYSATQ